MAEIDHLVIGALTLEEGARYVETLFGVRPEPGGTHPGFGTHNMLLSLGPTCYVEIIAPDPNQPQPLHPRPFDLDDPALRQQLEAEPRLIAYVASTPALEAVVARLGQAHAGEILRMQRGDLSWRIAFPPQRQDMDNLIPPLIQWDGGTAAGRLHDSGWRLLSLEGEHPEAESVRAALAARGLDEVVRVRKSPHPRLVAHLRHQDGREVTLSSG